MVSATIDGGAHIAQEQKQDGDDEQHALDQVMLDGMRGGVNQVGAVNERHDLDAGGQPPAVEFVDLFVDGLQHGRRVLRRAAAE